MSELRENQRQSALGSNHYDYGITRSMSPPTLERTPGLLNPDIVNACVEYFFNNLYPTVPILHRGRVQQTIMVMDRSIEAYCEITSLCAYVLFQPSMVLPPHSRIEGEYGSVSDISLAHLILDETIRVRKAYEFTENPTLLTAYTSFFIFSSYFCLDRQNSAWIYLRQAMTLVHILGLHEESTYKNDDFIDGSRKRRFFWVLFMTERCVIFPSQHFDTF